MKNLISLFFFFLATVSLNAQDFVQDRLENSPRHHEWVTVKSKTRSVRCFVVYPEIKKKSIAVLVIHENKGLTDWVRGVTDQLAEAGYLAIAPDLLSGMGPEGGDTSSFPTIDAATKAIYTLDPEVVTQDLNAVSDYVIKLPACNEKLVVSGFCWGGAQSFRFTTNRSDLKAAFVFYGRFEETKEELSRITCPVYGFYGENDARINATIPNTSALMKECGKTFEPVIYKDAGHGFVRSGEDPKGTP